jgi:hypothetical protein
MAIVSGLLIIGLAMALFITAVRPDLPLLRSYYWWRIPSKTKPTILERIPFALLGLVVFGAGVYSIIVSLRG